VSEADRQGSPFRYRRLRDSHVASWIGLPTCEELLEYDHAYSTSDRQNDNRGETPSHGALWNDLCQHEAAAGHQWQKEILDERERLVERGVSKFSDWEDAKKQYLDKLIEEPTRSGTHEII